MGGKAGTATASKPDPEASGGMGEAEGRVPPGLPILYRTIGISRFV